MAKSRGLCGAHYHKIRREGNLQDYARVNDVCFDKICMVEGCTRRASVKGICKKHDNQLRSGGPKPPRKGRKGYRRYIGPTAPYKNEDGYVLVWFPEHPNAKQGSIPLHRLRMSSVLNRPLTEKETVHHINGDRSDNRIDNLELWSSAQPSGQRVQDKINFAIEILSLYCPDKLA